MDATKKTNTRFEDMKKQQAQSKNVKADNKDIEIKKAEEEIAREVEEIEEKVAEDKITQEKADKEIRKEVDEEIEKIKENKIEIKKESKPKKTEAVVNARDLPISTKHSIAICNMIRNKELDKAISLLEQAEQEKIPVPMRGEIPHRKGIMSGRYPITALGHFIKLLKGLKANAMVNELELEKYIIFCKADVASRPYRRFGKGKFKRTHLTLRLIQSVKKADKKKQRDKK